eukprot:TRINITY_DN91_c1_g1_i9.p1 TRINITY_DN91_c1_g1~~TRINITY_DN91_c1_g1_i9.p1  ORF type:complete len:1069 (+),score=373.78 TRINITY_DN91_c1_g1_i9:48-3254(+)
MYPCLMMIELQNGNQNIGIHSFQTVTFGAMESCDNCNEVMWGLRKQGKKCLYCGYSTHHKCETLSPPNCTGVVVERKKDKKKKKKKKKKDKTDDGSMGLTEDDLPSSSSSSSSSSIPKTFGTLGRSSKLRKSIAAATREGRTQSQPSFPSSEDESQKNPSSLNGQKGSMSAFSNRLSSRMARSGTSASTDEEGRYSSSLTGKGTGDEARMASSLSPQKGNQYLRKFSAEEMSMSKSMSLDNSGSRNTDALVDGPSTSSLGSARDKKKPPMLFRANTEMTLVSKNAKQGSMSLTDMQDDMDNRNRVFTKEQLDQPPQGNSGEGVESKKAGEDTQEVSKEESLAGEKTEKQENEAEQLEERMEEEEEEEDEDEDDEEEDEDDEEEEEDEDDDEPEPKIYWAQVLQSSCELSNVEEKEEVDTVRGWIQDEKWDEAESKLKQLKSIKAKRMLSHLYSRQDQHEFAKEMLEQVFDLMEKESQTHLQNLQQAHRVCEYQKRKLEKLEKRLDRERLLNKKSQGQLREGLKKLSMLEAKDKKKQKEQSKQFANALAQLTSTLQQFEDAADDEEGESSSSSSSSFKELNVKDSLEKKKKRQQMSAEAGRQLWEKPEITEREMTGLENIHYRSKEERYKPLNIETELQEVLEIKTGDKIVDQHIWEEPDMDLFGSMIDLVMQKNELTYASVNRLIEYATVPGNIESRDALLLNYRTVISPLKFLWKVAQRFNVPPENDDEVRGIIHQEVYKLLELWVSTYPQDFTLDGELDHYLRLFVDEQFTNNPEPGLYTAWGMHLHAMLEGVEDEPTVDLSQAPIPDTPKNLLLPTLTWYDVKGEELARQLTIKDWETFKMVKDTEFLNLAWSKEKYQHLAPNLLKCIMRSNGVSNFVTSRIMEGETAKARGKMMSTFISCASALRKLNNVASMAAVVAGLNNMAVHRLKFSRKNLKRSELSALKECEKVMNPDGAYKNFRVLVNGALEKEEPVIPFLGVFCSDLTFVEDGNPDTKDGLINFQKKCMAYRIIKVVKKCQENMYSLIEVPQISKFFESDVLPDEVDDDELYNLSMKYEPRGAKNVK